MQANQSVILVLKPTSTFLSFLKSQLPEHAELPDLQVLQADSTAYALQEQYDDEAMLDEIERHFPAMFRHEIARWLGEDARNEIEGSFLDFLCCFKFEIHSHMLCWEAGLAEGNQILRIKPRSVMLKWLKTTVDKDTGPENVLAANFTEITENATIIVKNFDKLSEIKNFLRENYLPIFQAEMQRMYQDTEAWPDIDSYETFSRYFAVQIHTKLVHLNQ